MKSKISGVTMKDATQRKQRKSAGVVNSGSSKHEVTLLKLAKAGDEAAFGELVTSYRNRVASIAYQVVGNYEDASDIAQEVFIKLYRSMGSFDINRKFYTWVYRLTMNASIDFWRKNKRHRQQESLENHLEVSPQVLAGHSENLDFYLEQDERHQLFLDIADTLNENQKSAFLLCDIQGLSHDEVSEMLECPKVTLRWYLHEARKRIRSVVKDRYPEYFRQSTRKKRNSKKNELSRSTVSDRGEITG